MHIPYAALILATLCALPAVSAGQNIEQAETSQADTRSAASLLQSPMDALRHTLDGLKVEKWKGGTVRAEAMANIASIEKDLAGALPALIATSDAAPGSVSRLLPVSRNIDALYDVLLRVVDGARIAASAEQVDQLAQAMAGIQKARLALNDRLQQMSTTAERQISQLQAAAAKAQPAPVCPAPVTPPPQPAPAVKKKAVKKKPTPTPAPTTPAPKPNS